MPNIQFNARDELYMAHKQIPEDQKQGFNDKLRKTLEKELIKRGFLKSHKIK